MTLSTQFVTIIAMIIGGIYLGGAIDTFKRFNFYWKKRAIFSYLIEICFWLLQALILFYILYLVNQGELRFYILLALICGYATYKSLFEKIYKSILERVIDACINIYQFLYRVTETFIVKPIKLLIRFIIGLLLWIWGLLVALLWIIWKLVWYPIRTLGVLLWRLMPKVVKKYFYQLAGFYSKIKNTFNSWWKYIQSKRR